MPPDAGQLDVDARFLLANERTLLAWVRTALTLMAAGVALLQVVDGPWREPPAVALVLLGAATAGTGARRYRTADAALRSGRLPITGLGPTALAVSVCAVAVAVVVAVLVSAVLR